MTETKTRVPLAQAEEIAAEIRALLAPACMRLEIAGSIRRRRPDVGDVELVAVPKTAPARVDLFGTATGERDLLHEQCERLLGEGLLTHRLGSDGKRAFGPRFKRLVYHGQAGTMAVDLFVITPPAQWGVGMTIRTGPGEFSHRLVTSRHYGGGMPFGMRLHDFALWDGDRLVETPEEADFFRALGLAWIPPECRTDDVPLLPAREQETANATGRAEP